MASVELTSARTSELDPNLAADRLVEQLNGAKTKLAVLFASRDRDQKALNRALRDRIPKDARLIGATTGGEIDNQGIHVGDALLAYVGGDFEVGLGLGKDLSRDATSAGAAATDAACAELGVKLRDLDLGRHVGLVIDDGYRYKKEELLLGVLDKNQGLIVVGGGAADTETAPDKQSAEIHLDGEVVTDAVLFALFRTEAPWAALRHHPYEPTGDTISITKVDDTGSRVLEIDGKPAAEHYSDLAGVPVSELEFGKPNGFSNLSVALRVGREYFMRSPWKPLDDGSILFANLLEEGTELDLMRLGDMPTMTRQFFETELPKRVKNPSAALMFHCGGRMWMAQAMDTVADLSGAFAAAPPGAGMNCHFELYCGFHINTTLTTLAFGGSA